MRDARNALNALLLFAFLAVPASVAAEVPFQFAVPGAALPESDEVGGMRLAIFHGQNQSIWGVDFGVLSMNETARMSGAAFICGVHRLHGDMEGGASFSVVNLHDGEDRGFNGAFVNLLAEPSSALNLAYVNIARGTTLVDVGGVNISERATAQLGILNVTGQLRGLQLGILNMAENGFLPVFPFFNFPVSDAR